MLSTNKVSALFCLTVLYIGCMCHIAHAQTIAVNFDATITDADIKADISYAASQWNALLPTHAFTTTITFDLKNIGGADLAAQTNYNTLDVKGHVKTSTIDFNNNATFFLDTKPSDNSEFQLQTSRLRQNMAAAPDTVISGCRGPAVVAAARDKWDMVSVAEHEIGHALGIGFGANYMLYTNAVNAGSGGGFTGFKIGNQFAGLFPSGKLPVLQIPTTGPHFDGSTQGGVFDNTVMADPGFQLGERSLITDLDILGVGSVYNLSMNDITLTNCVPAPSALIIMLTGSLPGGCVLLRRRRCQGSRWTARQPCSALQNAARSGSQGMA